MATVVRGMVRCHASVDGMGSLASDHCCDGGHGMADYEARPDGSALRTAFHPDRDGSVELTARQKGTI